LKKNYFTFVAIFLCLVLVLMAASGLADCGKDFRPLDDAPPLVGLRGAGSVRVSETDCVWRWPCRASRRWVYGMSEEIPSIDALVPGFVRVSDGVWRRGTLTYHIRIEALPYRAGKDSIEAGGQYVKALVVELENFSALDQK